MLCSDGSDTRISVHRVSGLGLGCTWPIYKGVGPGRWCDGGLAIDIAFLLLDPKAHMPQLSKVVLLEVALLVFDLQEVQLPSFIKTQVLQHTPYIDKCRLWSRQV